MRHFEPNMGQNMGFMGNICSVGSLYTSYMNLLASSKSPVKPEKLQPTENAAENHSYRVHLQIIQWKT